MKKTAIVKMLAAAAAAAVLLAGCGSGSDSVSDSASNKNASDNNASEDTTAEDTADEAEAPVEIVAENDAVAIGPYKGVEYTAVQNTVTDEMISEQINALLSNYSTTEEADHDVVQEGDNIVFDYSGIDKDGVRFDGGTAEDYEMDDVGSGTFIPGFEENLIGHAVGDEYAFDITFPETYGNADLAGQEVTFEIKIKEILGATVVPELTDDFVADVQTIFPDAETVEEFEEALRESLTEYYEESDLSTNESAVWDLVSGGFTAKNLDPDQIAAYKERYLSYYQDMADDYSYESMEEFLSAYYGMTEEEFEATAEEYAENMVKEDAGIALIAELEGLSVSDEELAEGYARLEEDYGLSEEEVDEYYGSAEDFKRQLLYEKVVEWVYENASPVYETE